MLENQEEIFMEEALNMSVIVEKHQGETNGVPMFSHFSMKVTNFFSKPQRRKANEGVRIAHLDPETRMNSKDEFLQGTNIFMHAVRGVGV